MKPSLLVLNYTSDISGSSVALFRLLDAIEEDVTFLLITPPDSYLARRAEQKGWNFRGISIPVINWNMSPFYWLKCIIRIFRLSGFIQRMVREYRPQYFLVNCSPNTGWFPGWFLLKKNIRPQIIWMVHELELRPAWAFHLIRRLVERISSRILCVSTSVQSLFKKNTSLLPNIAPSAVEVRYRNPFQHDALTFLWTGTASPRKGLHLLPDLLAGFANLKNRVKLEIAASLSPKYQRYFESCIRRLKNLDIQLDIKVNQEDITSLYTSSKILLQTSVRPESFSLTVMEAMSRGMLVLASNKGGIKDYGSHMQNLIFLEELNQTPAEVLKMMKENPEKVLMIQQAAYDTTKQFTADRISRMFMGVIGSLPVSARN
jgi:glycosyltransferase involved in cell wall biosynthesis